MTRKKYHYKTDNEVGIRTITQIRNLPSKELSDEEFCKAFFDRFDAKALIMMYYDDTNQPWTFGRLKKGCQPMTYYRNIMNRLELVLKGNQNADVKEIEIEKVMS